MDPRLWVWATVLRKWILQGFSGECHKMTWPGYMGSIITTVFWNNQHCFSGFGQEYLDGTPTKRVLEWQDLLQPKTLGFLGTKFWISVLIFLLLELSKWVLELLLLSVHGYIIWTHLFRMVLLFDNNLSGFGYVT